MSGAALDNGSGLIVVLCCAGLAVCATLILMDALGVRRKNPARDLLTSRPESGKMLHMTSTLTLRPIRDGRKAHVLLDGRNIGTTVVTATGQYVTGAYLTEAQSAAVAKLAAERTS